MKRALIVGIDNYESPNKLNGCVNDAVELAALLEVNGDGSPNFEVRRIISSESHVTTEQLHQAIHDLFTGEADTVVLYFAGHGIMNDETNEGYLVTQDGRKPTWGVSLSNVLQQANKAHPKIKSTVILLDCCQSGFVGEVSGLGESGAVSHIGNGVTILTACHRNGFAAETNGHGKFTDIMLDGLGGAASDVIGHITPASLYAHIDQTLGAWEQRPIYKANVQSFISLREVSPKVPKEIMRRLPEYFPTASHVLKLDPSFEPDRGEEAERLRNIPVDDDNVRIYRNLQKCHQHGLITPTDHEYMWHTAVFSGGCRLTATGAHYRRLAEKKKI